MATDYESGFHAERERRLDRLEHWRARAAGVGAVLTIFAGLIGAALVRALGG